MYIIIDLDMKGMREKWCVARTKTEGVAHSKRRRGIMWLANNIDSRGRRNEEERKRTENCSSCQGRLPAAQKKILMIDAGSIRR
mmetsp:Transcript_16198/g.34036  ORF Transcript_16198/g.34036 Transcript_16198/m.34036 type:complete len:84 (-) Transcript_16198:343-594(-)